MALIKIELTGETDTDITNFIKGGQIDGYLKFLNGKVNLLRQMI
jgi:hypothetical protein